MLSKNSQDPGKLDNPQKLADDCRKGESNLTKQLADV
jgi:hypothetical protein